MNKIKSLLLGSTAVLLAATGAKAADVAARPAPAAEPVEYVKVCPTYGAGFFYIPGTDTCLKIGGFARFQLFAHQSDIADPVWAGLPFIGPAGAPTFSPFPGTTLFSGGQLFLRGGVGAPDDNLALQGRMFLNFDARTETAFGTLRAFIAFRVPGGQSAQQDNPTVQQAVAFVQFAGITAGLAPSVVDFANVTIFGDIIGDWNHDALQLAYTAQLGGGVSATIGIESPQLADTSVGYYGYAENVLTRPFDPVPFGGAAAGGIGVCYSKLASFSGSGAQVVGCETRTELPDLVANVRVDQAWGSAMLGGVVREVKSRLVSAAPGVAGAPPVVTFGDFPEKDIGWAVVGGVQVKLPMIAAGDQLVIKGAYGNGASRYTLYGLEGTGGYPEARWAGVAPFRGAFAATVPAGAVPAVFAGPAGTGPLDFFDFDATETWSVTGQFQHFWTPDLRSNFSVSYGEGDLRGPAIFPVAFAPAGRGCCLFSDADFSILTVQGNLIWSPVKNLDIGLELIYGRGAIDRAALGAFGFPGFTTAGTPINFTGPFGPNFPANENRFDDDGFGAVFRIQRNF